MTGVAGAALLVPAVSYAAGDSTALTERVSSRASALSGLEAPSEDPSEAPGTRPPGRPVPAR